MDRDELISILIATVMMSVVIALFLNYLLFIPLYTAIVYSVVITLVTLIGHEMVHRFTAIEVCHMSAEFKITTFAVEITLFSIFVLTALIILKQYTGWYTYFIPIVASPGAVFIDRMRTKCSDNVAAVAPFYNLGVGVVTLIYLFTVTSPPFVLNDVSNFYLTLIALISYFSFALAFLNSLPLKFGDIALDGYWAVTIDRSDYLVLSIVFINIFVSFVVLFMTGWWVIRI